MSWPLKMAANDAELKFDLCRATLCRKSFLGVPGGRPTMNS